MNRDAVNPVSPLDPLARWLRFNLVGAMGMVLQLVSLAAMNRSLPGHYLYTSAIALELTLLHNFAWHVHYTWRDRIRDRRRSFLMMTQLVRFHLSNGLVSILGNLLLMRILVRTVRMPVVAANGAAILCCSMVNYFVSHRWTFASGVEKDCGQSSYC